MIFMENKVIIFSEQNISSNNFQKQKVKLDGVATLITNLLPTSSTTLYFSFLKKYI